MKTKIILSLIILSLSFQSINASPYWGKTGHRVIGAIADQYLTGRAKRQIAKILNHQSEAFVSTYGDEIKSDKRYEKFYSWHFVNMPLDQTYQESTKSEKGDLVTGIAYCKKIIV
ncbi:MAG: S1/P1 nuclease, partial [Aquaticitalea sp.]